MKYALIDNDHELHILDGDDYKARLGPEGADRVPLHPGSRMSAFVNECGFRLPGRYPRNNLAALVANDLGGVFQPLAGPVVFTGWNPAGCGSEVRDLTAENIETLTALHDDYVAALDGTYLLAPEWAADVRSRAAALRAAPAPTITVLGL